MRNRFTTFTILVITMLGLAAFLMTNGVNTLDIAFCSLNENAMQDVIGGAGPMCVGQFTCDTPFTEGSNCAYCDSEDRITVCCDAENDEKCNYTGDNDNCQMMVRKVGPRSGNPGNCQTCTSSNYQDQGSCTGRNSATGDACEK